VVSNSHPEGPSLGDLARVRPADRTLQNLLGTLSAKLELASRIPIYEYEASVEGHEGSATVFQDLAVIERQSFNDVLVCLRQYLDEIAVAPSAAAPRSSAKEMRR